MAGTTQDVFPGQCKSGFGDVFVRKYDAAGGELWTRQFGTSGQDLLGGLAVDSTAVYAYVSGARDNRRRARQVTAETNSPGVAWTADGRILYSKQSGFAESLWTIEESGASPTQITSEANQLHFCACPDGRYFLYVAQRGSGYQLMRVPTAGGTAEAIAPAVVYTTPRCSPDGKWVVYTSPGARSISTLWKAPVSGGGPAQLSEGVSIEPAISPDGTRIAAFYNAADGAQMNATNRIGIFSADGGPPLQTYTLPLAVEREGGLQWTADGAGLSYVQVRDGAANIWVQPLTAAPPRRVTSFAADHILAFDWSRDGRQLAFVRGSRSRDVVMLRAVR
ncbi:MAG: TolB family protein [bacterium]